MHAFAARSHRCILGGFHVDGTSLRQILEPWCGLSQLGIEYLRARECLSQASRLEALPWREALARMGGWAVVDLSAVVERKVCRRPSDLAKCMWSKYLPTLTVRSASRRRAVAWVANGEIRSCPLRWEGLAAAHGYAVGGRCWRSLGWMAQVHGEVAAAELLGQGLHGGAALQVAVAIVFLLTMHFVRSLVLAELFGGIGMFAGALEEACGRWGMAFHYAEVREAKDVVLRAHAAAWSDTLGSAVRWAHIGPLTSQPTVVQASLPATFVFARCAAAHTLTRKLRLQSYVPAMCQLRLCLLVVLAAHTLTHKLRLPAMCQLCASDVCHLCCHRSHVVVASATSTRARLIAKMAWAWTTRWTPEIGTCP